MCIHPDMELGNLVFGYSRGEYGFPDRELVDSAEWRDLLEVTGSDSYGYTNLEQANPRGGYENNVFAIRPYWWGDEDNEEECEAPNFLYKPTGFEIRWYKYPFRDSYMTEDMTSEQVLETFKKCVESVTQCSRCGGAGIKPS